MKLYHPGLDVTIDRTVRQAETLAGAGWVAATDPPARNATTGEWLDHLATAGIDHDPDATRTELIDLWDARTH